MFNLLKSSFYELKKTKTIVILGLCLALALLLSRFFSFKIGSIAVVTTSPIITMTIAFLFGPIPAGIFGILVDLIGHLISPKGAYFFGFGLNAFLGGFIYGLFFYRKFYKIRYLVSRIICAKFIVSIFINLMLGTFWVTILNGKAMKILLSTRIPKELIVAPIHCLIAFTVIIFIHKIYYQLGFDE